MNNINNCPFCNSHKIKLEKSGAEFYVRCLNRNCKAHGPKVNILPPKLFRLGMATEQQIESAKIKAISAWNIK